MHLSKNFSDFVIELIKKFDLNFETNLFLLKLFNETNYL